MPTRGLIHRDVNKDLTPKDQDKDKDLTPKDQDKDKDLLDPNPQGQGQGQGLEKVLKESLRTRTRINIPVNSCTANNYVERYKIIATPMNSNKFTELYMKK